MSDRFCGSGTGSEPAHLGHRFQVPAPYRGNQEREPVPSGAEPQSQGRAPHRARRIAGHPAPKSPLRIGFIIRPSEDRTC
jgi:hypothetical protein